MAGGGQPPGRSSEPLPGEGSHPFKLHRSPRRGDGGGLPGLGLVHALEQGEDVTEKALRQAKEVIASGIPKEEESLTPAQVRSQRQQGEEPTALTQKSPPTRRLNLQPRLTSACGS